MITEGVGLWLYGRKTIATALGKTGKIVILW